MTIVPKSGKFGVVIDVPLPTSFTGVMVALYSTQALNSSTAE